MAAGGAFSWNSELPSGRNPFWIRDEALSGLGLHPGDAVSVDTRTDPRDGDLVVVEVELEEDSLRTARRYFAVGDRVRLEPVGEASNVIEVPAEQVIVMGVIAARLRFARGESEAPAEEPLG
jgi:SOS-response transcriptional repressor LexA